MNKKAQNVASQSSTPTLPQQTVQQMPPQQQVQAPLNIPMSQHMQPNVQANGNKIQIASKGAIAQQNMQQQQAAMQRSGAVPGMPDRRKQPLDQSGQLPPGAPPSSTTNQGQLQPQPTQNMQQQMPVQMQGAPPPNQLMNNQMQQQQQIIQGQMPPQMPPNMPSRQVSMGMPTGSQPIPPNIQMSGQQPSTASQAASQIPPTAYRQYPQGQQPYPMQQQQFQQNNGQYQNNNYGYQQNIQAPAQSPQYIANIQLQQQIHKYDQQLQQQVHALNTDKAEIAGITVEMSRTNLTQLQKNYEHFLAKTTPQDKLNFLEQTLFKRKSLINKNSKRYNGIGKKKNKKKQALKCPVYGCMKPMDSDESLVRHYNEQHQQLKELGLDLVSEQQGSSQNQRSGVRGKMSNSFVTQMLMIALLHKGQVKEMLQQLNEEVPLGDL